MRSLGLFCSTEGFVGRFSGCMNCGKFIWTGGVKGHWVYEGSWFSEGEIFVWIVT